MYCPECFSGHVNPGTPTGTISTKYGKKTYIATPPSNATPKGIIVIIPDAFGLPFVNNQILADHYAAAGPFTVYLPDFMDGRDAPLSMMRNIALFTESSLLWKPYYAVLMASGLIPHLIRNRLGVVWPGMLAWFRALRADTTANADLPVAAAGFCWGGLHAIKLAHDTAETRALDGTPLVDVAFAAHPSNVVVPTDVEAVRKPLSIAVGDEDFVFPMAQVEQARTILAGVQGVESEVVVYPGARHGFAVRASRSVPDGKEARQADEAEQQAVAWFQKQFAALKR